MRFSVSHCNTVVPLTASQAFFHLANAPMLPQVGYKIDQLSNNPDNQRSMYIFGKEYNIDGMYDID